MFEPQVVVKQTPDYCQKAVTSRCFFEQQNCWLKNLFRRKNWTEESLGKVGGSQAWSVFFPLERLGQPWNSTSYCTRKSNCFFIFYISLQILSLTSIFKFYLRLQSSCFFRTDFHFKWIKLVEKVHHQIEDFCHFLEKLSLARWFWVFLKKILFWLVKKKNDRNFVFPEHFR